MAIDNSEISKFNKRLEALRSERSPFMNYWGELSDYHLAHRGRFLITDKAKDGNVKRNTRQYNNTSRMASRTLDSGMMAGITSPSRPWFQLSTSDPDLNEFAAVKEWLHAVETTMYRVYSQSNFYNSIHTLYGELGVFGTGAMGLYADYKNVIRCKTYTAGSYMLGIDGQDLVDTFYREYQQSVGQLVKEFGIDNVSSAVKGQWENGNTEAMIDCVHAVEPNDDRDSMSPFADNKPTRSVYYENSSSSGQSKFLRKSGFDEFPVMAPRWDVVGENIYASDCPGMIALGDTKALQLGEKRKYQAVDKVANPPLMGDNALKDKTKGQVPNPGEVVFLTNNAGKGLESIYGNYRPDLNALDKVNFEAEQRIKRAFYEDLFLMLSGSDRRQITAREVAEKQEEKLLMLGPVLERLHAELLDPVIDRTFNIVQRAGILPPPPRELLNTEMSVNYVSVLAQAQRMVAVSGLQRVVGFTAEMAQIWPEARHKIDPIQIIDEYANAMGVNPNVIRPDDEVEQVIAFENQQQAQAAQTAQEQASVQTAKTASEIDTGGENVVTDVMKRAGVK